MFSSGLLSDYIKPAVLFISFLCAVSPILKTLTEAISTDTIWAMTVSTSNLLPCRLMSNMCRSPAYRCYCSLTLTHTLSHRLVCCWFTCCSTTMAVKGQCKLSVRTQYVTWSLRCIPPPSLPLVQGVQCYIPQCSNICSCLSRLKTPFRLPWFCDCLLCCVDVCTLPQVPGKV